MTCRESLTRRGERRWNETKGKGGGNNSFNGDSAPGARYFGILLVGYVAMVGRRLTGVGEKFLRLDAGPYEGVLRIARQIDSPLIFTRPETKRKIAISRSNSFA